MIAHKVVALQPKEYSSAGVPKSCGFGTDDWWFAPLKDQLVAD